jgi:hypothetical protein
MNEDERRSLRDRWREQNDRMDVGRMMDDLTFRPSGVGL